MTGGRRDWARNGKEEARLVGKMPLYARGGEL